MLIHRGLGKSFSFAASGMDSAGSPEAASSKLFGDINSAMLERAGMNTLAIKTLYDIGFHSELNKNKFYSTLNEINAIQLPEVYDIPDDQILPLIAYLPLASPHQIASFNRVEEKLERALRNKIDQLLQIPNILEFVYYALAKTELEYPQHAHKLLQKIKAIVAINLKVNNKESWTNLKKLFDTLPKTPDLNLDSQNEFDNLAALGDKLLQADLSLEAKEYSPERNLRDENYSSSGNRKVLNGLSDAFDLVLSYSKQPFTLGSIIENFDKSGKQNLVFEIPSVAHDFLKEGFAEIHFDHIKEVLLKSRANNLVVRGLTKKGFVNESRQLGELAKSLDLKFFPDGVLYDQLEGKTLYLNYSGESISPDDSFRILYETHNITEGQSLYDGLEYSRDNVKLSRALLLYYEQGREDFRKSFFVQDDSDSFSLVIPSAVPEEMHNQIGDLKKLLQYDANLITYFVNKDDSGSSPIEDFTPFPKIKPTGPRPKSPYGSSREMRGRVALDQAQRAGFLMPA